MYCKTCGAENSDGVKSCKKCGASLAEMGYTIEELDEVNYTGFFKSRG